MWSGLRGDVSLCTGLPRRADVGEGMLTPERDRTHSHPYRPVLLQIDLTNSTLLTYFFERCAKGN